MHEKAVLYCLNMVSRSGGAHQSLPTASQNASPRGCGVRSGLRYLCKGIVLMPSDLLCLMQCVCVLFHVHFCESIQSVALRARDARIKATLVLQRRARGVACNACTRV